MRSLVILFVVIALFAPAPSMAIELGDARATVVNELGEPESIIKSQNEAVLRFSSGVTVTFRSDRVVSFFQASKSDNRVDASRSPFHRPKMSEKSAGWISFIVAGVAALIISPIFFRSKEEMFTSIRREEQGAFESLLNNEFEESRSASALVHLWLVFPFLIGIATYFYLLRP